MAISAPSDPDQEYTYFLGFETCPSLRDNLSKPGWSRGRPSRRNFQRRMWLLKFGMVLNYCPMLFYKTRAGIIHLTKVMFHSDGLCGNNC